MFEKTLAREGIEFKLFSSAQDALNALASSTPQVVVSDIRMPGGSGLELLQKLKERYPHLPVIIMTVFSDLESAVAAFQGGAFEYLPKPFDVDHAVVQLHIEWMAPSPAKGVSQDRGNSGVFFGGGRYEIQVLDSYESPTYPDGQAGAVYGQYPPLVNACRKPGEWQAYDIVFETARFDAAGTLTKPASVTVFHNGVVVQHATVFTGPSTHKARPPYKAHPEKLPIGLQDHGNPVRYRNIWIREL